MKAREKKAKQVNYYLLLILFFIAPLHAVTFVYNMRIAETTRQRAFLTDQSDSIAAAILIAQFRTRYNGGKQRTIGGLTTISHEFERGYIRMDAAIGNVREKGPLICRSRTDLDDLLFSGGYRFTFNEKARLTFSGLLGIPTHNDTLFQGVQFGTGHMGIGAQADASLQYSENNMALAAARLVHFLPASVLFCVNNIKRNFTINLGNVVDFLVSNRTRFGKNVIEIGYNPGIGFDSSLCPTLPTLPTDFEFIRSSFFGHYLRGFVIKKHLSGIILGFSYSFDHKPKIIGFKRSFTTWLAWGITF